MAILLHIVDGTNGMNGAPETRGNYNCGGLEKITMSKNAKITKGAVEPS